METKPAYEDNNQHKEFIRWGYETLNSLGYKPKSDQPEKIKDSPWSYLVLFDTVGGYVYLKHTPEMFALEPAVIKVLHDNFSARVPELIANNDKLNCFLMKDAGKSLREILKKEFDAALFCRAIDQFTSLQIEAADHTDILFDIGVPDYSLDKLPDLYDKMISQHDLLKAESLTDEEIIQLEKLSSTVSDLCTKLSAYPVKQSIVQPDFNDNNTLIDEATKNITIIDLGEIVISHPFFSLINCLEQIKKHHGLSEKDEAYIKISDACFKNHMNCFNSKEQLFDAIDAAKKLSIVYEISYQYRFMLACGKESLATFQHWKLGKLLRDFMVLYK